jgi:predicted RNase H-like nuclease (RuvC/YqgF family)
MPTIAPMSESVSLLVERATRLMVITRRLSEENRELRAQLDAARQANMRLEARVNEARARVESALARMPLAETAES